MQTSPPSISAQSPSKRAAFGIPSLKKANPRPLPNFSPTPPKKRAQQHKQKHPRRFGSGNLRHGRSPPSPSTPKNPKEPGWSHCEKSLKMLAETSKASAGRASRWELTGGCGTTETPRRSVREMQRMRELPREKPSNWWCPLMESDPEKNHPTSGFLSCGIPTCSFHFSFPTEHQQANMGFQSEIKPEIEWNKNTTSPQDEETKTQRLTDAVQAPPPFTRKTTLRLTAS